MKLALGRYVSTSEYYTQVEILTVEKNGALRNGTYAFAMLVHCSDL